MINSENVNLDKEKFARIDIHNEFNTLKINIEKMFLTYDINELAMLYVSSKNRIDRIYEYHLARI